MTPRQRYQTDLASERLLHDPDQEAAVACLQALHEELQRSPPSRGLVARITGQRPRACTGIYLWGGVGRGKTYLMDRFYDSVPGGRKQRWHFSKFMQYVHGEIARLPRTPDPLEIIAAHVAEQNRLLCLDEFHVDDIGDAMLMAGLLKGLFSRGVTLVMTSNVAPDDLYKHGLQRSRFLPAIELIKQHNHIVPLNGDRDYRKSTPLGEARCYPIMPEADAHAHMRQHYTRLTGAAPPGRVQALHINQRKIHVVAWSEEVLWSGFHELCVTHRSASDYLEIAERFNTLLLTHIPVMAASADAAAQRFIDLIDVLYDNRARLLATLAAPAEQLYCGRRLHFSFRRTVSRLYEMAK